MKGLTWLNNKKLGIVLLGFMIMYGFSTIPSSGEVEQTEDVLRIGVVGDPENLNPILAFSGLAWSLINWMYEPLVRWDLTGDGDWQPAPGLAESWDLAPNGTQLVFHLVQNATWHDGTPITSADVNWTLFTWTWLGWWRASTPHIDHHNISIIDDYTIAVNFVEMGYTNIPIGTAATPYWAYRCGFSPNLCYNSTPVQANIDAFLLALPYMPILPMHIWDDLMWNDPVFGTNGTYYTDVVPGCDFWCFFNYDGINWRVLDLQLDGVPFDEPKVGAGPWVFDSWTVGDKLVFTANDDYHWGRPNIDKIEIVIYTTVETATQAVLSGDIDFTETSVNFAELGNLGVNVKENRNEFMGFEGLFINQNTNYLNKTQAGTSGPKHMALLDEPVKKAIGQAIDKDRINQVGYLGTASVTDSIVHQSFTWHNDALTKYTKGATAAMATLQADGWFLNTGGNWEKNVTGTSTNETLVLDLKYSSGSPEEFVIANLIKEDLGAAKIKVNILPTEPTTFTDDIGTCTQWVTSGCWNYDIMLTFLTQTGDPNYLNFYMTSTSIVNLNALNIPRVDELYLEQQLTSNPTARKTLMDELQQLVYDDGSIVPLVNYEEFEIYRADRFIFNEEDESVHSGLFSLYNTFAFQNVKVGSSVVTSGPSTIITTISGSVVTLTIEPSTTSPGFTVAAFFLSLVLGVVFLRFRKRK